MRCRAWRVAQWMTLLAVHLPAMLAGEGEGVPVRGGRLSVRVEASGGRLLLTAGRFLEWVAPEGVQGGAVRRFIPTEITIQAEGSQRGEYFLVPAGGEAGWHQRIAAELTLNQRSEWRLPAAAAGSDARALWNGAPAGVEIRQDGEGGWKLFLRTRDLALPGGAGEVRRHETGSVWTERVQRFPMVEGRRTGGEVETRSEPREVPLDIQVGGVMTGEARWHSNLGPPSLSFHRAEGLPVTVEGAGRRLRSGGELEEISLARLAPDSEGGFGGSVVQFRWDFRLGEPPDAGWWQAVEPDLENWLPSFGDALRFRLKFSRLEGVEGVRFRLLETSRHPGVATNAWHGLLLGGAETSTGRAEMPVELREGDAVLAWKRGYPLVESGPRDSLPDLYFEQARNPAGIVEGRIRNGGAVGEQGTELRFEKLAAEVEGVVTVADWAAAGKLVVEARIDGLWEELRARGAGAEADEVSVRFPLDGDGDGIPDAFAVREAGMDDGDGLDLLEEYRGIFAGGRHVRLDPGKRDVFLIDYGQAVGEEVKKEVATNLAARGVAPHWLGLAEHREERVGKSARVVVVEKLETSALPLILREDDAVAQVSRWRAIRPRPGVGTVFVDGATQARWLAEDIWLALAGKATGGRQ